MSNWKISSLFNFPFSFFNVFFRFRTPHSTPHLQPFLHIPKRFSRSVNALFSEFRSSFQSSRIKRKKEEDYTFIFATKRLFFSVFPTFLSSFFLHTNKKPYIWLQKRSLSYFVMFVRKKKFFLEGYSIQTKHFSSLFWSRIFADKFWLLIKSTSFVYSMSYIFALKFWVMSNFFIFFYIVHKNYCVASLWKYMIKLMNQHLCKKKKKPWKVQGFKYMLVSGEDGKNA